MADVENKPEDAKPNEDVENKPETKEENKPASFNDAQKAEIDRMVAEAVAATKKAIEDEDNKKKLEANGEYQKLLEAANKEKEELAKALAEKERIANAATVLTKVGLPLELADRLVGSTADELKKDATKLKELLTNHFTNTVNRNLPPTPTGNATNSSNGDNSATIKQLKNKFSI